MTTNEKIKELETKLAENQAELEKLKAEVAKEKTTKRWEPDWGEEYWYYCAIGHAHKCVWRKTSSDKKRLAVGNVYREEPPRKHEALKRKQKLLDKIAEVNARESNRFDWSNHRQMKVSLAWSHETKSFRTCYVFQKQDHEDGFYFLEDAKDEMKSWANENLQPGDLWV